MLKEKIKSELLQKLTKFIPPELPLIILRGPLKGKRIITGAPAGVGKGISLLFHLSEPERLDVIRNYVKKNDICFDVGANVGINSILLAKYGKFVYCFEPLPRNISYLFRMLSINRVRNAIIIPCAVSNVNELSWFKKDKKWIHGKLDQRGFQPVSVLKIDDFVRNNEIFPDILKIDVEGNELNVLKGSEITLKKNHPIIIMETHGQEIKKKCFFFLEKYGYKKIIPLDSNDIQEAKEFIILTKNRI